MRRVAWLVVPVALIGLLGLAVFASRGPSPTTAFTLTPGDCFNVPSDAQVGDIATVDCRGAHDAEVFVAGSLASPSPSADAAAGTNGPAPYPGDAGIGQWVVANCGMTALTAYLGADAAARSSLAVGYFFPDAAAWAHGERQVTCYLHAVDGSKLSAPLGVAASPSAGP